MTETNNTPHPGNDPTNFLQRPFQGGADGLADPPTMIHTYGEIKYKDGEGPAANVKLPNGTGSGLSGLPQADAGTAPAQFNDPKSPPGQA